MSDLITTTSLLPLPSPKVNLNIRPATMADFPWMDALQNRHRKMVGWQAKGTFEGKIRSGEIIVAEVAGGGAWRVGGGAWPVDCGKTGMAESTRKPQARCDAPHATIHTPHAETA